MDTYSLGMIEQPVEQQNAAVMLVFVGLEAQIYEALLEDLVLFVLLWWFSARPRNRYAVSGLFALLYGIFRFAIEFVRVPDAHLGYIAFGWLTMGQILCLPLIAVGLTLLYLSRRSVPTCDPSHGYRRLSSDPETDPHPAGPFPPTRSKLHRLRSHRRGARSLGR